MAKSCIIDNGDDNACESSDLPESGALSLSSLSDRLLSCKMDDDANYIINGTSKIVKSDIANLKTFGK